MHIGCSIGGSPSFRALARPVRQAVQFSFCPWGDQRIQVDCLRLWPHIASMSRIRTGGAAVKTMTFAMVHFTVAFSIAYLLTGSISIASALALIEPMANTVAYYFHERLWQRFRQSGSKSHSNVSSVRKRDCPAC
jgi:uncharacterized membrane protein